METKIRRLLKLDINVLTPLELQEIKENINFILKEKSFDLNNKFKKEEDRIPAMFIMAQHQPNFNNEIAYDEFICKVVYVPNVLANCINGRGIISFFGFTGSDLDTVVKCHCFNMDISINSFGESNKFRFINLGINDLHKIFRVGNKNLANTLIIINGITYESLTFILLSHGIKLHGGSHSRRHLLQPLELKLAFSVKDLPDYLDYYVQSFIEPDTINHHELELIKESKYKSLKGRINNNYYNNDTYKMFLNPDFQNLIQNFKQLIKIAYKCSFGRDVLYTIFLKNYSLCLDYDELKMVLNQKGIDFFNNLLNEVEKRDTGDNKATIKAIGKRGIHTLSYNRFYSSINPYKFNTDLAKLSPEKILFFNTIKTILQDSNLNTFEAQKGIETQWNNFVIRQQEDNQFLVSKNFPYFVKKMENVKDTLNILETTKVTKRKFPTVYKYLNDLKLIIVTYAVAIYGVNMRLGYNNICSLIGKKVIFQIYCDHIQTKNIKSYEDSENIEKIGVSIEDFRKSIGFENIDYIKLGSFLLDLLMTHPVNLFEKSFNDGIYEMAKLEFNETNLDIIRDNLFIDPNSLPMIHRPCKWSDTEYGGYISNKVLKEGLITGSHYHGHSMENRTNIYNAINKMSSIKFNFNKSLLEYLKNDGSFLLNSIFTEEMTKSENLQIQTQLIIAELYKEIPFYIPLQVDWRGRIYVQSFFANYQGSDLSLSLIEFAVGKPLTKNGLDSLYVYGANLYNEKNISKASFSDRIEWVINNKNKILDMKPEFMINAENKFSFAGFCLIMRELDLNPEYKVKLPVFLDATCSGIQHLAAIIKDCELAKEVNLIPRDNLDVPADIYESLRIPINEEIRKTGRENPSYPNLQYVNLSRSDVKHPIMTKTYNVTLYGVNEQLKDKFREGKSKIFKVSSINSGEMISLRKPDIMKIAEIINKSIFVKYKGLNFIYDYFIEMAKLKSKLNLPVVWLTASGLLLTQKYYKSKETKISLTLAGKTKKLVVRDMTTTLDPRKQNNSIIPNVIHSLDASHVANIINNTIDNPNDFPIITIHDCFGTHPNNMSKLEEIVKLEFVALYASESFLTKFHDRNLQSIEDYGLKIERDEPLGLDYVIYKTRSKLYIPNIPKLGNFNINSVLKSKYIIN